ncbi:MAG TPA: hypothetical protein VGI55_04245 [Solirubrobacteraceae bacterium]
MSARGGALRRRERRDRAIHEAGFDDLVPAHLTVLASPGSENRRPSELASQGQIETELELALGPERFGQLRTLLIALNQTSLIYDHGQ